MASDLLNTSYGADALREAVCDQIRRRMRRWFKRHAVVAFDDWVAAHKTGNFDFETALGNLNVAHDQEIYDLYQLLKELELGYGVSTPDFYMFVDTENGDDELGDGSVDAPFVSLTRALRLLPKKINGAVNIFLAAPTGHEITDLPDLDLDFGPDGQLTIQANTAPTLIAGGLTSTGWTNIGVAYTYAHGLVVAAAGWAPDMYQGYFVHVTSGASSGAIYAIAGNTADTLIVPHTANVMAPGDTFSIITPSDFINLGGDDWSAKLSANRYRNDSRFVMVGINFSAREVNFNGSISMIFPFTTIDNLVLSGSEVHLNEWEAFDDTQIGWADARGINPFTYLGDTDSYCDHGSYHNGVTENLNAYNGHFQVKHIIWQQYQMHNQSSNSISQCYCFNATGVTVQLNDFDTLTVVGLWIEQATDGIAISPGSVFASAIEGTGANISGYTVSVGAISNFQFNGTPVSATTNDVYWQVTAAAAAFPGVAGTGINDGEGARVIKLT